MDALAHAPAARRPLDRRTYLLACVGLLAAKCLVDAALLTAATGRSFQPLYALTPLLSWRAPGLSLTWELTALGLFDLPILLIGVVLSSRRAADAGLRPLFGVLFAVPVVSYLVCVLLCVLPRRTDAAAPRDVAEGRALALIHSAAAGAAVGIAMMVFSVMLLRDYGSLLFVGAPFVIGAVAGFRMNRDRHCGTGAAIGAAQLALLLVGAGLIAFALEGLFCVGMAYPLAAPLAALGACLGAGLARRPAARVGDIAALLIAWPFLTGAEALHRGLPVREVVTAVEIDAPPAAIWPQVTDFTELPPPDEWAFRLGIAYPQRARIEGRGVGAVRYCEFSTGAFVEPITAWDAPTRLAFDVAETPPPMREWSPYETVHAPHLSGNMRSRRGEFRLVALPGGRTRLEGSTWYELDMFPQAYWGLWSDALIHAIHTRVLGHIKHRAETK